MSYTRESLRRPALVVSNRCLYRHMSETPKKAQEMLRNFMPKEQTHAERHLSSVKLDKEVYQQA